MNPELQPEGKTATGGGEWPLTTVTTLTDPSVAILMWTMLALNIVLLGGMAVLLWRVHQCQKHIEVRNCNFKKNMLSRIFIGV